MNRRARFVGVAPNRTPSPEKEVERIRAKVQLTSYVPMPYRHTTDWPVVHSDMVALIEEIDRLRDIVNKMHANKETYRKRAQRKQKQLRAIHQALEIEGWKIDGGDFDRGIYVACQKIRQAISDPDSILDPKPAQAI